MSYDVYVGGSDQDLNMTSNIGKMYYDHIPDTGKGGGIRELHETKNADVVQIIATFFDTVNGLDRNEIAAYNATNGWGTGVGALIFMARIMGAAAQNPDGVTTIWI
jgi:hypothetical protein